MTTSQAVVAQQGSLFDIDSPLYGKMRGERSVMDFPFFPLSKIATKKNIDYQLEDVTIQIRPGPSGIATMYDKEIILYVASLMAQQLSDDAKIERDFTFTAHDFFRSTGVSRPSKRDYQRFTDALERLQGTQIKTNIETGNEIERGWFSWLSEARANYKKMANGDEQLRIVKVRLCEWLFRAIQRDGQIYAYHNDYFKLGTIERRLYEIAHCHCEGEQVEMPLDLLSAKVGSTANLRKFKQHLREIETEDRLPEYSMTVTEVVPSEPKLNSRGRRINTPDTIVVFTPRGKRSPSPARIASVAA